MSLPPGRRALEVPEGASTTPERVSMTDPRAPRRARAGPSSYLSPDAAAAAKAARERATSDARLSASIRAAVAALADAPFLTPSWFDAARAASRVVALARLDETMGVAATPPPPTPTPSPPASPAAPAPAALPATLWERTDPPALVARFALEEGVLSATLRAAEAHRAATRRFRDIRRGAADEQKADDPASAADALSDPQTRLLLERVRTTAATRGVDVREVARALVAHEANLGLILAACFDAAECAQVSLGKEKEDAAALDFVAACLRDEIEKRANTASALLRDDTHGGDVVHGVTHRSLSGSRSTRSSAREDGSPSGASSADEFEAAFDAAAEAERAAESSGRDFTLSRVVGRNRSERVDAERRWDTPRDQTHPSAKRGAFERLASMEATAAALATATAAAARGDSYSGASSEPSASDRAAAASFSLRSNIFARRGFFAAAVALSHRVLVAHLPRLSEGSVAKRAKALGLFSLLARATDGEGRRRERGGAGGTKTVRGAGPAFEKPSNASEADDADAAVLFAAGAEALSGLCGTEYFLTHRAEFAEETPGTVASVGAVAETVAAARREKEEALRGTPFPRETRGSSFAPSFGGNYDSSSPNNREGGAGRSAFDPHDRSPSRSPAGSFVASPGSTRSPGRFLALAEEKALREEARRTRHLEEAARALARVRLGRGAGSPGARPGTARESGAAIAARIRALSMG